MFIQNVVVFAALPGPCGSWMGASARGGRLIWPSRLQFCVYNEGPRVTKFVIKVLCNTITCTTRNLPTPEYGISSVVDSTANQWARAKKKKKKRDSTIAIRVWKSKHCHLTCRYRPDVLFSFPRVFPYKADVNLLPKLWGLLVWIS